MCVALIAQPKFKNVEIRYFGVVNMRVCFNANAPRQGVACWPIVAREKAKEQPSLEIGIEIVMALPLQSLVDVSRRSPHVMKDSMSAYNSCTASELLRVLESRIPL
jgi:hypothetical protein